MKEFSDEENKILDTAYETFMRKEYALRFVVEKNQSSSIGIESWATLELMISLDICGIKAVKRQKPDLIIGKIGTEIKCGTNTGGISYLLSDFKDHPEADLHLFLTIYDKIFLEKLEKRLCENNIIYKYRKLNSSWLVMISKKKSVKLS